MQNYELMIAEATYGLVSATGWTELRTALLGDYAGTVIATVSPYPRSVNWHSLPGQTREQGTAVLPGNSEILYQENDAFVSNPPEIQVGYPPGSSILTVYGIASSIAGLSAQGNTSMLEQYLLRLGNPYIFNVVDLRIRPTDTTSTSVYIEAGFYEQLSTPGVKRRFAGGSLDLSAPLAALNSGEHQLAIAYIDVETEALGAALTPVVSTASTLPARTELSNLTSVRLMARQKALGTLYLYSGQSTIVQDDIMSTLDPRFTRSEQPGVSQAIAWNNIPISYNNRMIYL